MSSVHTLKTKRDYIEVQQCDLDVEEELRAAYAINGPVVSIIAEFREQVVKEARTNPDGLREALEKIADRCSKLRRGTDDWFELVEIEHVARGALASLPHGGE